nr:hypothetical protein [Tanacetum cinerariifolium]
MSKGLEIPIDPHHTPIVTQPSSSQPQKKRKSKRKQRKEIKVPSPSSEIPNEESVPTTSNDPLPNGEDTMMNKEYMFGVNDLDSDEVIVDFTAGENVEQSTKVAKKEVSTADPVSTADELVTTAGIEVTTATTTLQIYCELATRLQEEERGELSIEEKSRLFVELMDKRKKHFARLKAEKIRSKPPTKAQKRNQMCTYLKNMENYNHNQLKSKSFEEIQILLNNTMKWIEAFLPMDTQLEKGSDKAVEDIEKAKKGSSKRVGSNLEQEDAKRQRLEEENETAELKRCLEIIPKDDDDVTIKATPLSSKSLTIIDYKIYKERKKSYFKIIRVDGKECKLYDEFDKFAYKKGNITDLQTNVDQLHAYLGQHEFYANEVCLMHERNSSPLALVATHQMTQHMPKQCTKPKRKIDESWFKDKVLLVQDQANGQIIHEEELAFLADPRIAKAQPTQTVITHNAAYKADDLNGHDFDCDEINTAKVTLMANLSHYGSDDLAEVHNYDNVNHNLINQAAQVMPLSEQSNIINQSKTKITSDSNIIPYSQYVSESQQAAVQNSKSPA